MAELTEGQKAEIRVMLKRLEWSTVYPDGNGGASLIPKYDAMARKLGTYGDLIRDYKNSLYEKMFLDKDNNVQLVERISPV